MSNKNRRKLINYQNVFYFIKTHLTRAMHLKINGANMTSSFIHYSDKIVNNGLLHMRSLKYISTVTSPQEIDFPQCFCHNICSWRKLPKEMIWTAHNAYSWSFFSFLWKSNGFFQYSHLSDRNIYGIYIFSRFIFIPVFASNS